MKIQINWSAIVLILIIIGLAFCGSSNAKADSVYCNEGFPNYKNTSNFQMINNTAGVFSFTYNNKTFIASTYNCVIELDK